MDAEVLSVRQILGKYITVLEHPLCFVYSHSFPSIMQLFSVIFRIQKNMNECYGIRSLNKDGKTRFYLSTGVQEVVTHFM